MRRWWRFVGWDIIGYVDGGDEVGEVLTTREDFWKG